MIDVKVVIGASFGDEGKGGMVDYFSHTARQENKKCLVVLSNGGAQRGHTVDTIDGKHHIFHHFGSGTFNNADTYCSEYFILNPMTFRVEYAELAAQTNIPNTFYHPLCKWSTPYDMLVNQIVEECRDKNKHGSCGVGIWETEVRYKETSFKYHINSFNALSIEKKVSYLKSLRDGYYVNRLKSLGVSSVPESWRDIFYSDTLIYNFISDVEFFCNYTKYAYNGILNNYDSVIFENGQGLLLDQSLTILYGDNLTPSNTGCYNASEIMKHANMKECIVEICYVSRTYMTRHGVGLFETECDKEAINPNMVDSNNVENTFQGKLRYGELILPNLITRVTNDSRYIPDANVAVAFTHTNEYSVDYSKIPFDLYLSAKKTNDGIEKFFLTK